MKNRTTIPGSSGNGGLIARAIEGNPKDGTPLDNELNGIREALGYLDKEMASLEAKLERLRVPIPCDPETDCTAADPTGVLGELVQIRRAVDGHARRVSAIRASLVC